MTETTTTLTRAAPATDRFTVFLAEYLQPGDSVSAMAIAHLSNAIFVSRRQFLHKIRTWVRM